MMIGGCGREERGVCEGVRDEIGVKSLYRIDSELNIEIFYRLNNSHKSNSKCNAIVNDFSDDKVLNNQFNEMCDYKSFWRILN